MADQNESPSKVTLDELFIEQYGQRMSRLFEFIYIDVEIKWPGVTLKLHGYLAPRTILLLVLALAVMFWPTYLVIEHYQLWP